MRKAILAGLGLVLGATGAARFGGWAVVTVEQAPDYFVAGKAADITFTVRQHGVEKMRGIKPVLRAQSGRSVVSVDATPVSTGVYRASLTVPQPGDWRIVIESGHGRSTGQLLPIKAIAAGATPPAAPALAERGKIYFASKGCVTCHVHGEVDFKGELDDYGPNLTDKRFAAEYLAAFLADPSIKPQNDPNKRMVNLELSRPDILALVAFINSERKVSSR